MIPGDLATRLRQLTDNSVQPSPFIHKLPANLPELVPGQQFTARIQNPLPDGSFQALVAGKTITLALPHAVKSGDVLELIVTGQREQSVTAKLAAPGLATDDLPQSSLSQTGRLISQLLTGRFGEQRATALAAGEPLLPAAPDKPQELSPRLQQAVATSGLFYESHLKAWAEGRTALANLLREPHARYMPGKSLLTAPATDIAASSAGLFAPTPQRASAEPPPMHESDASLLQNLLGTHVGTSEPVEEGAPPLANSPAPAAEESQAAPTTSASAETLPDSETTVVKDTSVPHPALANRGDDISAETDKPSNAAAETARQGQQATSASSNPSAQRIPEQLMPLIYQQLETMATHQLQYQFQPWPGMHVEWDIIDPEQDSTTEVDTEKAWRSSLRLHLPTLGDVDALLVLGPQGLSIRLDTSNEASAARMRMAGKTLLDALAGAGLSVNALSVSEHASA